MIIYILSQLKQIFSRIIFPFLLRKKMKIITIFILTACSFSTAVASTLPEYNEAYGKHLYERVMSDESERNKSGFILGYANRLLFLHEYEGVGRFLEYFHKKFPDEYLPKEYIAYLLAINSSAEVKKTLSQLNSEPYYALKILLKERKEMGSSNNSEVVWNIINVKNKSGIDVAESFYFLAKEKRYQEAKEVYTAFIEKRAYDNGESEKREIYYNRVQSVLDYSDKFVEAYAAYYVGEKEEASDLMSQVVKENTLPDFVQREYAALYLRILDELGESTRLLSEVPEFEKRFPDDYRFPLFHALALFQTNQRTDAQVKYREALQVHFNFALPFGEFFEDYYEGSRYVNFALYHNLYFQGFLSKYYLQENQNPIQAQITDYLEMAYGYELLNMHTQAFVFKEEITYLSAQNVPQLMHSMTWLHYLDDGLDMLGYKMFNTSVFPAVDFYKQGDRDSILMDAALAITKGSNTYDTSAERILKDVEKQLLLDKENPLLIFAELHLQWQLWKVNSINFSAPIQNTINILKMYPNAVFLSKFLNEAAPEYVSKDDVERKQDVYMNAIELLDFHNTRIFGDYEQASNARLLGIYSKNVSFYVDTVTSDLDLLVESTYKDLVNKFNQFHLLDDLDRLQNDVKLLDFPKSSKYEQRAMLRTVFGNNSKSKVLENVNFFLYSLDVFDSLSWKGGNYTFNRAMLLKIIYSMQGEKNRVESNFRLFRQEHPNWTYVYFKDVAIDSWYAPYVLAARQDDLVQGYKDGTFQPGQIISRAAMLKLYIISFHLGNSENWREIYATIFETENDEYSYLLKTFRQNDINEDAFHEDVLCTSLWFYIKHMF